MTSKGLVRSVTALVLVAVIPYLVVSVGAEGTRGSVWIICVGIAMWSGWRLSGMIANALPRLYEFMFWLFCYIFMGIAPAAQLRTDKMPSTTPFVLAGGDLAAATVVVLGIVGFEIGALTERTRRTRLEARQLLEVEEPLIGVRTSQRTPLFARIVPLMGLTTLCAIYYVHAVGVSAFFASRDLRDHLVSISIADSTTAAILATLSWVPALVVVHRIVNGTRNSDGTRSRLRASEWLTLLIAAALIIVVNNPLSSARYIFGAMALSLVVLFGGFRDQRRTRRTMIGLLAALFLVFPIADLVRREATAAVSIDFQSEYQGNGDYDAFAQIHNTITVTHDHGFTLLQQPLGVAFFWVPRSVWPSKPEDTGIFIAEQRGYSFTNLSAPLWAEFYLIGGVGAVLAGFVAVGHWIRRADTALVRLFDHRLPFSVIGSYLPFYMMIILRGSLLQATALVAVFLGAVRFTRPVTRIEEPELDDRDSARARMA
ncbi:MAG: biotin synthase [Acidimicrobiales bacterium]|nr:biotin synthase [Acidimicrobiales bacterium]